MVEKAWESNWKDGMESHQLRTSLFNTTTALRKWNKGHFGMAHEKIKTLEGDLEQLQLTNMGLEYQRRTQEELNSRRARMESILR